MKKNKIIALLILLLLAACAIVWIRVSGTKESTPAGTQAITDDGTMEVQVDVNTTEAASENNANDNDDSSSNLQTEESTEAEEGIIEHEGDIEIVVPEGEDTFGE